MAPFAVILDVDGTLVDSNDAHAHAWVDAFAEAGIDVSYDRVRRAIGMGGDKLMPHVAGIREDSREGTRISKRRGEIFSERYLPHLAPFPRCASWCSASSPTASRSWSPARRRRTSSTQLLEIAGVADLIATTASSGDAERSKPDPGHRAGGAAAVRRSGGAAIMLGDTPYDVEAALRAGIGIVASSAGGWGRTICAARWKSIPEPPEI